MKKYLTHNDTDISISGTSLQGYCDAGTTYYDLVNAFGEPQKGDGYKVDAEWSMLFSGRVATIYNYKTGKNYCGSEGRHVIDMAGDDWHIGGHGPEAVAAVKIAIEVAKQSTVQK